MISIPIWLFIFYNIIVGMIILLIASTIILRAVFYFHDRRFIKREYGKHKEE